MNDIEILISVAYAFRTEQALYKVTFYDKNINNKYTFQICKNGVEVITSVLPPSFDGVSTPVLAMKVILEYLENRKKNKKKLPTSSG